ncbi:MAG: hypothetical protein M5T52_01390 [Ignavibacteriaceae bacterium]|nr:hypothetical protein [Ignavibacteriaceae bacterium]
MKIISPSFSLHRERERERAKYRASFEELISEKSSSVFYPELISTET